MNSGGLRYAKVIAVHPEAQAVDLLFFDNGARVPFVQVLSGDASTNSGLSGLTEPAQISQSDPYNPQETKDRDIYAVVGTVGTTPVVLGFLFPQVCQMLFADMNRRISRHPSDVYSSIDNDGNFETFHPSGTYFRVGTSSAHEDLTSKDYDQKWKISKNTDKAVHIHFELWNGGAKKASFDVDPSGNIVGSNVGALTWNTTGNVSLTAGGNLTGTVSGNLDFEVTGTAKIKAPTITLDGNVSVTGTLGVTGATTLHGATSTGDIVADGKSLEHHVHGGVQSGGSSTAPPT